MYCETRRQCPAAINYCSLPSSPVLFQESSGQFPRLLSEPIGGSGIASFCAPVEAAARHAVESVLSTTKRGRRNGLKKTIAARTSCPAAAQLLQRRGARRIRQINHFKTVNYDGTRPGVFCLVDAGNQPQAE